MQTKYRCSNSALINGRARRAVRWVIGALCGLPFDEPANVQSVIRRSFSGTPICRWGLPTRDGLSNALIPAFELMLVARWVGVISARRPAVIIWSCYCRTDGSGPQTHAHATAHVGPPIDASTISASAIDAACANTAGAVCAASPC
jgi:hypothetical protein